LRERTEDIAQLAAHFLAKFSAPLTAPTFGDEALRLLKTQPWAGNIRELQNVIERALILSEDQAVIGPEHCCLRTRTFATRIRPTDEEPGSEGFNRRGRRVRGESLFSVLDTGPECAIEKDFGGLCFELLFPFAPRPLRSLRLKLSLRCGTISLVK